MTGLFEVRDGRVTLAVGRCEPCGRLFFPPQSYGCEVCGATGGELAVVGVAAVGTLLDAVRVPGGDGTRPGFTVAEIRLAAGVVVRALAADGMTSGTEVVGAVRESGGRQLLTFGPAEGPAEQPAQGPPEEGDVP